MHPRLRLDFAKVSSGKQGYGGQVGLSILRLRSGQVKNVDCGAFWLKSLPRSETKFLLLGRTFFDENPEADF